MSYKPSYKEKQDLARSSELAAGLVSDRYSGVSSIVFRMTYYQSAIVNRVLMTRTLNFLPRSYAYFHLNCMRDECENGGFDLAPVVAEMVKKRMNSKKGNIFCHGKKKEQGTATHASLSYEINIRYKTSRQQQ